MTEKKSIAIDTQKAPERMLEISSEIDTCWEDAQTGYEELNNKLAISKGDYIDALKVQIDTEKKIIEEVYHFFRIVLQTMQSAETDFETLDETYAKS